MSPNHFRHALRLLLGFLQLEQAKFSAYSIRRGGASHAFAAGKPFDQLLVLGRWQSVKTARVYLDAGRAELVQMQFSPKSLHLIDSFQQRAAGFCEQLRQERTS